MSFLKFFKKKNKKENEFSMNDSFYITLVVIVMLFSCIICFFIGLGMVKVDSISSIDYSDQIFKSIVDQQSKTLAIASLCVAMVSLINTVISIFRDKKLQKEKIILAQLKHDINNMESTIKTITSINAIQILESKDSECYYDVITQYLDAKQEDDYVKLALLSLKAVISKSKTDKQSLELACYDDIVDIASSILKISDSVIEKQFALLESINALYKRARIRLYDGISKEKIKADLITAKKQLGMLLALNPIDTFGHILNLKGLVHFWTAKIENNNTQKIQELNFANNFFNQALEKNPNKCEFLNHLGVVKINLYKAAPNSSNFEEIKGIYDKIISIDKNYFKAYLNLVHIYIDEFESALNISYDNPLSKILSKSISDLVIKNANEHLIQAENNLKISTELAPNFIDNHYKTGALLTYKYLINKLNDSNYEDEKLKKNILDSFAEADKIMLNATKTLVYKRNYYDLIGDCEKANEINDLLIERKDPIAIKWKKQFLIR